VEFAAHAIAGLVAYLLGSIPSGFLAGRAKGIDIRKLGSGNIGATNVFRFLGKPAGVAVLFADFLKGWIACAITTPLLYRLILHTGDATPDSLLLISAVCAVLGHNYTVWLNFKGGKGIATSAGVLAAVVPIPFLCILTVWILTLITTRYVSLASILAALSLPLSVWLTGGSLTWIIVTGAMTALAVGRHHGNIRRLLNGTEHRFSRKRPPTTT
jgi:glycerol-3-phosphate acyltransferase PlsY